MSILSNPRTLYFTRILQLLFGIGFLVLISDSGVHRGWWKDINGALAVGSTHPPYPSLFLTHKKHQHQILTNPVSTVIATILTFALTLHALITHHMKSNPFSGGSSIRTILRLVLEVLVFLLWVAAVVLMLRPKGGCPVHKPTEGIEFCFWGDGDHDYARMDDRPVTRWNIGIAFAFVEM